MRTTTVTERLVQAVLTALAAVIVIELVQAWSALPCGTANAGQFCYPWGTEGPAGEIWYYRSKIIYLSALGISLLILVAAVLLPFVAKRMHDLTIVMLALSIGGHAALYLVGSILAGS